MCRKNNSLAFAGLLAVLLLSSCVPSVKVAQPTSRIPGSYNGHTDTTNSATVPWRSFFNDPDLSALIDTALANNQELNILVQEITIAQNEVRARKGEYLPFVDIGVSAGLEKTGRFTRNGAVEENLPVDEETRFPDPLPDIMIAARASWELDIWKKLRNAKQAAMLRYLGSVEGRNFAVTNLVAEIASSYYELMALDNQLEILRANISIQQEALEIVKMEKQAAKVTELAVRRFEAEVLKNRSLQFEIQQRIIETENRLALLVGKFPQKVQRDPRNFTVMAPDTVLPGLPEQLLANRPDIKQRELELMAAKLDVRSARANFYPALRLTAAAGVNAFDASALWQTPQSMIYGVAADLVAPLVNRNAIKAMYISANARQLQALYDYQRTVLNAFIEVQNQMANIANLRNSYELRAQQVSTLNSSVTISGNLFRSARADYMEVLLTQRDALESKFELVDTRLQQMNARVSMYQALGGGWR